MIKRFVLDGPPGSGKSTLLFGCSDDESPDTPLPTVHGLGYACVHESVAQAHESLSRQGLDFAKEKELWLQTIVEIDRDKFAAAPDGIVFYDRSFHHWKLLSRASGIRLPDWYDPLNETLRYDDPIFLIAPVKSMDLTSPDIHESRRFTWDQRCAMYADTKALYTDLGYTVVDVPVFVEGDVERNNQLRIDLILEYIS